MKKSLLVFTKKTSNDLRLLAPRPELLVSPFDKASSRLRYRPDYFRFSPGLPLLADELKGAAKLAWDECCEKRSRDLLKLDRGLYVISYSGGIDSTALLVSIIKHWPAADQKRVVVSLSHDSIDENPSFFESHVSRFRLVNSLGNMSRILLEKDALMVTGELGDQLFGSDLLIPGCEMFGDGLIHENYRDGFAKMMKAWSPPDEGSTGALFDRFAPIVDECPFPVRSMHDFVWWFSFTQKWNYVKYRFYELATADLRLRYGRHVIHFYDTPEFQRWSLENHDLKIGKTLKSYKWTAKDYIYDFTKDPRQHELMKIQSLEKMYFLDAKRIAIDDDFREVATNQELMDYVAF